MPPTFEKKKISSTFLATMKQKKYLKNQKEKNCAERGHLTERKIKPEKFNVIFSTNCFFCLWNTGLQTGFSPPPF